MDVPLFRPGADPGPNFLDLLKAVDHPYAQRPVGGGQVDAGHGTTVLAVRFDTGVAMAGDRRATAGNLIAHHSIRKVFPADRHSGVAIAGAAGPAVEMVRLFQLQLEHYEKVEGIELSLEGKANQLGNMVRANLPAAMQGLAVVPLFAGYDIRRATGRLYQFDVTGGRYEERDYATSGSGSLHAGTVLKIGFVEAMTQDAAIELAVEALYYAAEEDSATGGPDPVRGIYPVVATIGADGFQERTTDEVAAAFERLQSRLRSRGTNTDDPSPGGMP
jgi:proteasome beta subunit